MVLSGNLIQLFFWELTSLFSFLLIGYWHHNAGARDGARVALTVTATGGFCLFAGMLVLGHIVGSYDLDRVLASGNLIRSQRLVFSSSGPHSAWRADQEVNDDASGTKINTASLIGWSVSRPTLLSAGTVVALFCAAAGAERDGCR